MPMEEMAFFSKAADREDGTQTSCYSQSALFPKSPFPRASARCSFYFSTSKGINGNVSTLHKFFQILWNDTRVDGRTQIGVSSVCNFMQVCLIGIVSYSFLTEITKGHLQCMSSEKH
jgi:hypothetical protein